MNYTTPKIELEEIRRAVLDIYIKCPYPPMSFQAEGHRQACDDILAFLFAKERPKIK